MYLFSTKFSKAASLLLLIAISASGGIFKSKKYENPIDKDTQQPDKKLFDKAIKDIEKGRYEIARLSLNVLINTYDASEYLAKAKLAVADSWYREGGSHGLAQAEAEYKDFILFYPAMEEAPEAQSRICMIHFKQMEKTDRDTSQALRAEQECRQLITQFPNSKFVPQAEQRLREIQEALADGEATVGAFYHRRGSNPAAANRLAGVISQYPLYSGAADALWLQADSYSKMGKNFRGKTGEAYQRIVRDYPLSKWTEPARKKLKDMEMDIPEADPKAVARMQYEKENYVKPGTVKRGMTLVTRGPDVSHSAKSGAPQMTSLKPSIPASVPMPVDASLAATTGVGSGSTDVTISTGIEKNTSLDTKPDARMTSPTPAAGTPLAVSAVPGTPTAAAATPVAAAATTDPLPVNHTGNGKTKAVKPKKLKKAAKVPQSVAQPATPVPPTGDAAK